MEPIFIKGDNMKSKSIFFLLLLVFCLNFAQAQDNKPQILMMFPANCVGVGTSFNYPFKVIDLDLCKKDYEEELYFDVIEPSSVGIGPNIIKGPNLDSNGICKGAIVEVFLQACCFTGVADSNSQVLIKFTVRDKKGYIDSCRFYVTQSGPILWKCPINFRNTRGDFGTLYFGQAEKDVKATTGDGSDGAPIGTLDKNLCEEELPKVDEATTFDVRWRIPLTLGTQTNIFPYDISKIEYIHSTFSLYPFSKAYRPIEIYWDKTEIPAPDDVVKNPYQLNWYIRDAIANGNYIMLNMRTGVGDYNPDMFHIENRGDTCFLTVLSDVIASLGIYGAVFTPVVENSFKNEQTSTISPNPFSDKASFQFYSENDGLVKISIYDMLGNCVQELLSEFVTQGYHEIAWQPGNISPGAYICLFQFGKRIEKSIVILER